MNFAQFKILTRIEQTLFGLPYILSGAVLGCFQAQAGTLIFLKLLWILPAFFLARISGMAFNQLIDRHIDAKNPRTCKRLLPSGTVTSNQVRLIAWGSLLLFGIVCSQINLLTALLALPAMGLLYVYSYMKRLHPSCHFVLGAINFLGPVMAFTAIANRLTLPSLYLGGIAACSVIVSDILYALQDVEFDRSFKLFSFPACFGVKRSLLSAAIIHCGCLVFLVGLGISAGLAYVFYLAVPLIGGLLFRYYVKLQKQFRENEFRGIEASFFFYNVAMSFSTLIFLSIGVVWAVL